MIVASMNEAPDSYVYVFIVYFVCYIREVQMVLIELNPRNNAFLYLGDDCSANACPLSALLSRRIELSM